MCVCVCVCVCVGGGERVCVGGGRERVCVCVCVLLLLFCFRFSFSLAILIKKTGFLFTRTIEKSARHQRLSACFTSDRGQFARHNQHFALCPKVGSTVTAAF